MYGKASTPDSRLLYPDGAGSHSAVSDPPLVGVRGDGYYSAVTRGAKDTIDGAIPLVREASHHLPDADASRPFTLTGIGCADGGTSMDLVRQAILGVSARWPWRPLVVIYTDQPRLARAMMPRASLLILDEPTSSLDPRGEQRFFAQLRCGIAGQSARPSVVFISHRFSTVRQADTILLRDEAKIRAEGSHEELIGRDAGYAELFEAQARWYR
jgi:hypothetical protein